MVGPTRTRRSKPPGAVPWDILTCLLLEGYVSMARAPYIHLCDVYAGSPGPGPGALIQANVPCRFVLQDEVASLTMPSFLRVAWITMDLSAPGPSFATTAPGSYNISCLTSAQISFPAGLPPQWYVVLAEAVVPVSRPSYYRYSVALLPF